MLTISLGSEQVYQSHTVNSNSCGKIDSATFVVAYQDTANANHLSCKIGTISGGTITYGSAQDTGIAINDATTVGISVAMLSSTVFVIGYGIAAGAVGNCIVATISGSSITFGTQTSMNSLASGNIQLGVIDSTHVIVSWSNTTHAYTSVGTITATNISFVTVYDGGPGTHTISQQAVCVLDSTHIALLYTNSTDQIQVVIGVISLTTVITFGSPVQISSTGFNTATSISTIDATHFIASYDGTNTNCRIGTVSSGNIIAYGTANSNGTYNGVPIVLVDSTDMVLCGNDSNSGTVSAQPLSISGTTITYGTLVDGTPTTGSMKSSAFLLDSTHVVISYSSTSNSNFGAVLIGTLSGGGATTGPNLLALLGVG